MQTSADSDILAQADRERLRGNLRFRFRDSALETLYRDDVRANARFVNRITLTVIILVIDAFFLTEHRLAPEIFALSAYLRFALLTPACLLFVLLDWRGKLGRCYDSALTLVATLPTIVVAILIVHTTSLTALPNVQATPLIELVIATSRLDVRQAVIVNVVSLLAYIAAIAICPIVPAGFLPSMVLTAISIALGALAFAIRVDLRDRQVFLLGLQAERRRSLLAEQNTALARLTQIDALTGLGNRRSFDDMLTAAWAACSARQVPISLVMVDIDHFKSFNDNLGHQAGDDCLRRVGRAIGNCVRTHSDTAARYGGEEFAIILPGATQADGRLIAERVNAAVMACAITHPAAGPPGYVTASLGVATVIPSDDTSGARLIEAADRCLYAAKRTGRNRVACADLVPDTPYPARSRADSPGARVVSVGIGLPG